MCDAVSVLVQQLLAAPAPIGSLAAKVRENWSGSVSMNNDDRVTDACLHLSRDVCRRLPTTRGCALPRRTTRR